MLYHLSYCPSLISRPDFWAQPTIGEITKPAV